MKSLLKALVCTMLVGLSAFAEGSGGVKGGGGIVRNGEYLTFRSAGIDISVGIHPLDLKSIPGLAELLSDESTLNLSDQHKNDFFEASYPAGARKYFSIASISPALRTSLIDAYYKAINQQAGLNELVPYAFTIGKETYLLPEFFKLVGKNGISDNQAKEVILFQEALWAIDSGKMTEDTATEGQITFEKFLIAHGDHSDFDEDLYHFLQKVFIRDPSLSLIAAAKVDFKSGRLQKFLGSDGALPVKTLLGNDWTLQPNSDCICAYLMNYPASWKRSLVLLSAANPGVLTFSEFLRIIDKLYMPLIGGPDTLGASSEIKSLYDLVLNHTGFDLLGTDPLAYGFLPGLRMKLEADGAWSRQISPSLLTFEFHSH